MQSLPSSERKDELNLLSLKTKGMATKATIQLISQPIQRRTRVHSDVECLMGFTNLSSQNSNDLISDFGIDSVRKLRICGK